MDINVLCENKPVRKFILRSAEEGRFSGTVNVYESVMPFILRGNMSDKYISEIFEHDTILVRNWDEIGWLNEKKYSGSIVADAGLYSYNKEAVLALRDAGVEYDTVPYELNFHEIAERGCENSEIVIYGRIPLMITAQCLYRNTHGDRCEKRDEGHDMIMTDRMRTDFPVHCFCSYCTNVIYNSVPLSLHNEINDVIKLRPKSVRLYFTNETPEEAAKITDYFSGLISGSTALKIPFEAFTKGHFRKGVE